MSEVRDNIEIGMKIVATCAALFGIGKYFYDLALDRRIAARSAALQRIAGLNSGEANEARKVLFDFWTSNAHAVNFLGDHETTSNAYYNFLVSAFYSANNSDTLFDAVYTLSEHYDDVYFCVESQLCDGGMIDQFYCPRVSVTSEVYGPIIQALKNRSGYSNFGAGLERLHARCPPASHDAG